MAPDILMRAGNTLPTLRRVLELDGSPVDLTNATSVTFKASGAAGIVISGSCAMSDRPNGQVDYSWSPADSAVASGFYQAWYEVAFPGSNTLTVPNGGYLVLQITAVSQGAWSYSGNPSSSTRDAVRYHLGDTDSTDPLMSDGELDYIITDWSLITTSPRLLAADAAENLANRYAREVTVSADAVTAQLQELAANYRALAVSLRAQDANRNLGGPDIDVDADSVPDPTVRPLNFAIGMHDNKRSGPTAPQIDEFYGGVW
jgi:hypothetical protein